jgi:thiosulfate reductase/polysulfide reductase chain A
MILKQIGERLGIGDYFPYKNMDDLVRWQLADTGFSLEDFDEKGFVAYCKDPIFWDREEEIRFKTPSGKIEFKSSLLEDAGYPHSRPTKRIDAPPEGKFRLVVGRNALHTHISTQNNAYLNDLSSENQLWINDRKARRDGHRGWHGGGGRIPDSLGTYPCESDRSDSSRYRFHAARIRAHGGSGGPFLQPRAVGCTCCMENITDKVGGSPALHDTFVSVAAA